MAQLKEIGIETVRSENTSFWTSANAPTQSAFQLDFKEVLLHVKALYLLTDRIVAASSFFFESAITRDVTVALEPLFSRGEIIYFVDSEVEDFDEHGISKIETTPKLASYKDRVVVKGRAKKLAELGYILKRPSCSISDKIVDIWIRDLCSEAPGALGGLLLKYFPNENERLEIVSKLVGISRNRGHESFVWEYLKPKLESFKLPQPFLRASKYRLSTMYARATSDLLDVAVDRSELTLTSPFIQDSSCYDSDIFLRCMESLGVRESLAHLDPLQLIALKYSHEFIAFKEFYFILIKTVGFRSIEVAHWLVKYRYLSRRFALRGVTRDEFVGLFQRLCKSIKKSPRRYKTPLEVLLNAYSLTNVLTIEAFVELIRQPERMGEDFSMQAVLTTVEYPAAQRIKVDHKPLVKAVRPTRQRAEDYVLDQQKVLDIITVIDNQGHQFEKTPNTYKNSEEEDLRNIILVGLNTLFEGSATGETFSANGKTDIYLNIVKGSILVCECKIWGGQKLYHETIDQLLGYVTWRHNFGIIITFVKIKNLTKVLKEMPDIIEAHGSFKTGVKEHNQTHFISTHTLKQDDDKEVQIHHLFYNLYA